MVWRFISHLQGIPNPDAFERRKGSMKSLARGMDGQTEDSCVRRCAWGEGSILWVDLLDCTESHPVALVCLPTCRPA